MLVTAYPRNRKSARGEAKDSKEYLLVDKLVMFLTNRNLD